VLASPPADPQSVQKILRTLKAAQTAQDRAHDSADLRQLMRTAVAQNDDLAMIDVLQIARSEMPEAIKTLQRALERVVEDGRTEVADESTVGTLASSSKQHPFDGDRSADSGNDRVESWHTTDTLDQEFIETGIDALRRLSTGTDLGLPSWTITRYEVDLEAKIGIGFFSEVYRGTWRRHTVAVKVLAQTTPRKIFVHEVEIWKKLYHPNVLELLGASSATGNPPWFLVSTFVLSEPNLLVIDLIQFPIGQ
jgi:abelson tyrosine-protein kinase 1